VRDIYARPGQLLYDHLLGVCRKALPKAARLNLEKPLFDLIVSHDLGKASFLWQQGLQRGDRPLPDHVSAGAKVLLDRGSPLFLLSHSHHGSLGSLAACRPQVGEFSVPEEVLIWLSDNAPRLASEVHQELGLGVEFGRENNPWWLEDTPEQVSLRLRLLFSLLGDMDIQDAREFDTGERQNHHGVQELHQRFLEWVDNSPSTVVSEALAFARHPPGRYRITSPHPIGKTTAGLGYGLAHARAHDLDRVVLVAPYLSHLHHLEERLTDLFGERLVSSSVLQHHTGIATSELSPWAKPLILTTSAQFWGTLNHHHKMALRNVHYLSHSVVILDENQALTSRLHDHYESTLNLMRDEWGCSIVQTGQTIRARSREMPARLSSSSGTDNRSSTLLGEVEWSAVASRASESTRAMVVTNTIADALEVASHMPEGTVCLTSRLCSRDRQDIGHRLRLRTQEGPLRVVATPLTETDTGMLFGLVLRAMCGAGSLLLSRAHLLPGGEMGIFTSTPPRAAGRDAAITQRLLQDPWQLTDSDWLAEYYDQVLATGTVSSDLVRAAHELDFRGASRAFRLISDNKTNILLVRHPNVDIQDEIDSVLGGLRSPSPRIRRKARRDALRYSVPLSEYELNSARNQGLIGTLATHLECDLETPIWLGGYDDTSGGLRFFS